MDFFNTLIDNVNSAIEPYDGRFFPFDAGKCRSDVGHNQLVLLRDAAFELDGTGFNLVSSKDIVGDEGTLLIGEDLTDIKKDRAFARVCLIELCDITDEQLAYDTIRKIEYEKYHYFPDGYMIRTSSVSQKETVRLSKSAIKQGISFENIGNSLIERYKHHNAVKKVKVIFLTHRDIDYGALSDWAVKGNGITKALNRIINDMNFDCTRCNMKIICDEVEGMRELHFKKGS